MLRRLSQLTYKSYKFRRYSAKSSSLPPIGFIGLGNFGSDLVEKFLKNGVQVIGYDKDTLKATEMMKLGAKRAKSAKHVAEQVDIIFTCLPNYTALLEACDGEKGITKTGKKGLLVVDLSSVGPINTLKLHKILEEDKVDFLSAPVSGGIKRDVEYVSAIFLVGGDKKHLKRVEGYFKQLAPVNENNVFHIGPDIGDGQAARVCNILLLACTMLGTSEIMNLGIKLGLNPTVLIQAINASTAQCWACTHYNPVSVEGTKAPVSENYGIGESVNVMLSILSVAQDLATRVNAPIPAGALACQMYSLALARGYGDKDFSVIYKLVVEAFVKQV